MKTLYNWLLLLLLLVPGLVLAQEGTEISQQDVIYLKNGSILKGNILEYHKGDSLILEITGSSRLVVKEEDILRITWKGPEASPEMIDVLYLKNGSVIKGLIREHNEKNLKLILPGGNELVIAKEDIERRTQEAPGTAASSEINAGPPAVLKRQPKPYEFKERGLYNVFYLSTSYGNSEGNLLLGLAAHNITGFQINRWIGLGLGFGLDTYSFENSETILPVFGEIRGYFNDANRAPYFSMSAGYGFALKDEEELIREAKGGFMIHPAFGLRLGADADANVLVDIGYKFQRAEFTREFFSGGEREIREITYKRFTIRLGLLF